MFFRTRTWLENDPSKTTFDTDIIEASSKKEAEKLAIYFALATGDYVKSEATIAICEDCGTEIERNCYGLIVCPLCRPCKHCQDT